MIVDKPNTFSNEFAGHNYVLYVTVSEYLDIVDALKYRFDKEETTFEARMERGKCIEYLEEMFNRGTVTI